MSNPLEQDPLAPPGVSGVDQVGRGKGKGLGKGSRDGAETTGLASEVELKAAMAGDRKKTKQLYEALDVLFKSKADYSIIREAAEQLAAQLEKAELSAARAISACRESSRAKMMLDHLKFSQEVNRCLGYVMAVVTEPAAEETAVGNEKDDEVLADEQDEDDDVNEEEEGNEEDDDEIELESLGELLERITAAAADRRASAVRPKRTVTASSGKTATKVATTGKGSGGGPLVSDAAPDDWIEDYVAGRSVPTPSKGAGRSTVRAKLETYDGKVLGWFNWIGLFRSLVHDTWMSADEKLGLLKQSVKGDHESFLKALSGGESAYRLALKHLKSACGSRALLQAANIRRLEQLEPASPDSPSAFYCYAEQVRLHLFDLTRIGEASNSSVIEKITSRLTVEDRRDWNVFVRNLSRVAQLNEFGDWLVERAQSCISPSQIVAEQYPDTARRSTKMVKNHVIMADERTKKTRCPRCSQEHWLDKCKFFQKSSVSGRKAFVTDKHICFSCLKSGHSIGSCRSGRTCAVEGCGSRHHELLHVSAGADGAHTARTAEEPEGAFGVTHAFVTTPGGERLRLNVFLDPGSSRTLVREGLVHRLGLKAPLRSMGLSGVGGFKSSHLSKRVTLAMQTVLGTEVTLDASSIASPCDPLPVVDWPVLKHKWAHMSDLPLEKTGGRIDVLIGFDNNYLLTGFETREGSRTEPTVSRTRLGWVARGPLGRSEGSAVARCNFVRLSNDRCLDELFGRFCDTESFGCELPMKTRLSPEEQRAFDLVESGTRRKDAGYEIPLLWKDGEPRLTNNKVAAERRFVGLFRRFAKDPSYETDYRAAMSKYLTEGYARRISDPAELAGNDQFFLPHHGVYKASAEKKKLRVVFDAAAVYGGRSLNDTLLTGPALQTDLPSVLIRFRRDLVAVTADVEAMFNRVRLRPSDARYHRFLWQEIGEREPSVYQMDRLTFGAKCSPFVALYALRRAARESDVPGAAEIVENDFYVDDYLASFPTESEAVEKAEAVRSALAVGDFHLRNWTSNISGVQVKLNGGELIGGPGEFPLPADDVAVKVLGVSWRTFDDRLTFSVAAPQAVPGTRREILSCVASIFDPLGLASPLTVQAKIGMKCLAEAGLRWDDVISSEQTKWWAGWFERLQLVNEISVPRCLFVEGPNAMSCELHTFSDASEHACAAAVYLRVEYKGGRIVIRLVMAKTKLAPRRTISVAKLELQAALLGVRVCSHVESALGRLASSTSCVLDGQQLYT